MIDMNAEGPQDAEEYALWLERFLVFSADRGISVHDAGQFADACVLEVRYRLRCLPGHPCGDVSSLDRSLIAGNFVITGPDEMDVWECGSGLVIMRHSKNEDFIVMVDDETLGVMVGLIECWDSSLGMGEE